MLGPAKTRYCRTIHSKSLLEHALSHCALKMTARACFWATWALEMTARACFGATWALQMTARACFGVTWALKITARACFGVTWALKSPARACFGATWALRMTARACFAGTVLSKSLFEPSFEAAPRSKSLFEPCFEDAVCPKAWKPLRARYHCSDLASKTLHVCKYCSNPLVSVSLISVTLDSSPLCSVHGHARVQDQCSS